MGAVSASLYGRHMLSSCASPVNCIRFCGSALARYPVYCRASLRGFSCKSPSHSQRSMAVHSSTRRNLCTLRKLDNVDCGISSHWNRSSKMQKNGGLGFAVSNGVCKTLFPKGPTHVRTCFYACGVAASNKHLAYLAYALENGCKHGTQTQKRRGARAPGMLGYRANNGKARSC